MNRNTKMLAYPIVIRKDTNGSLLVTFPDVPEAATSAYDSTQALRVARDALESALGFYFEDGRAIPMPSAPKPGQKMIALTQRIRAKIIRHNNTKH